MIAIDRLNVAYGDASVLKDCALRVTAGRRIALMGPSGCGKTTLINAIAGLAAPDSGSIQVNGRVSYVFQEPALFPWLTAEENVNVVLSDKRDTLPQARRWLEEAGLADSLNKYPHQLSGGQKQRVAICRALAFGGELVLLDEPFQGLDENTKAGAMALCRKELAERTTILVTHDRAEAQTLADRIYILHPEGLTEEKL